MRFEERDDPTILEPTEAIVRTVATCVCGSDLWRFRGLADVPEPTPIGHEFVGVVEAIGDSVSTVKVGDFVFTYSDDTCPVCRKGADAVLECVGTEEARKQAVDYLRPGGMRGVAGMPHGNLDATQMFWDNKGVNGGVAPVRAYLEDLMGRVLDRRIEPGKVFDLERPLSEVAEAYRAMDERRAKKVLLRP